MKIHFEVPPTLARQMTEDTMVALGHPDVPCVVCNKRLENHRRVIVVKVPPNAVRLGVAHANCAPAFTHQLDMTGAAKQSLSAYIPAERRTFPRAVLIFEWLAWPEDTADGLIESCVALGLSRIDEDLDAIALPLATNLRFMLGADFGRIGGVPRTLRTPVGDQPFDGIWQELDGLSSAHWRQLALSDRQVLVLCSGAHLDLASVPSDDTIFSRLDRAKLMGLLVAAKLPVARASD